MKTLDELLSEHRISVEIKHDGWWLACQYNINDEPCFMVVAHDPSTAVAHCIREIQKAANHA